MAIGRAIDDGLDRARASASALPTWRELATALAGAEVVGVEAQKRVRIGEVRAATRLSLPARGVRRFAAGHGRKAQFGAYLVDALDAGCDVRRGDLRHLGGIDRAILIPREFEIGRFK